MTNTKQAGRLLLLAFKIALGSSLAIYLANLLQLEYATSAGSITLLTLLITKWETVRLSIYRLVTFVITVVLIRLTFLFLDSGWIAYGICVFLLVFICGILGWKSTISVNAVIGTHFLMERDFSQAFIRNELLLVIIGITMALLFSLLHDYHAQQRELVQGMRHIEHQLQMILGELSAYLSGYEMQRDVWQDIRSLEAELQSLVKLAYDYQENTFQSHPQYYIDYFEMRANQCNVLHNLHFEMHKMRKVPEQGKIVANYILCMMEYVVEINIPTKQLDELSRLFEASRNEPLPVTHEEFEARSMLFHVLMDLEDFLIFKRRFVEQLDDEQKRRYWYKEPHGPVF